MIGRVIPKGRDESGAHAAQSFTFLGALKNGMVRGMDRLLKPLIGGVRFGRRFGCAAGEGRVSEAIEKRFGSERAGDFAGGRSAYAIADDKDAVFRQRGAGVLIRMAHAAGMGEHREELAG